MVKHRSNAEIAQMIIAKDDKQSKEFQATKRKAKSQTISGDQTNGTDTRKRKRNDDRESRCVTFDFTAWCSRVGDDPWGPSWAPLGPPPGGGDPPPSQLA